ncbi:MAG: mechanosensitive ion channel family protein [Candidatus Woesearchaeota archaeon]
MIDSMIGILESYGIPSVYASYVLAAIILFVSLTVLRFFKFVLIKYLKMLAKKTKNNIDLMLVEAIDHIGWFFYVAVSTYISLQVIPMSDRINTIINYSMLVILTYYVVIFVQNIIDVAENKMIAKRRRQGDDDTAVIEVLARAVKWSLWLVAGVTILANMGYNVAGIIAGLGIGGLAIAIALQGVLTDIFAAFTIYFDKPFKRGDFIIIGDDMGVVKHIGIKSTRIQTLQGQELVVSNRDLTDSRVNNFGLMEKRRVVFNIGVTYQTSPKKLKKINQMIKEVFESIDNADLDRVHFTRFGPSSLDYEIVYYVNSRDFNIYMDIQQKVNLELVERFAKAKIEFAYPTQTIFVEK